MPIFTVTWPPPTPLQINLTFWIQFRRLGSRLHAAKVFWGGGKPQSSFYLTPQYQDIILPLISPIMNVILNSFQLIGIPLDVRDDTITDKSLIGMSIGLIFLSRVNLLCLEHPLLGPQRPAIIVLPSDGVRFLCRKMAAPTFPPDAKSTQKINFVMLPAVHKKAVQ